MDQDTNTFKALDFLKGYQVGKNFFPMRALPTDRAIDWSYIDEWVGQGYLVVESGQDFFLPGKVPHIAITETGLARLKYLSSLLGHMKRVEKLDAILSELYKHRYDGKFYDIIEVAKSLGIHVETIEIQQIADQLVYKSLAVPENKGKVSHLILKITPDGILYCEKTSFANSNKSIAMQTFSGTFTNSPIVAAGGSIANSSITQNVGAVDEAADLIRRIRELLQQEADSELKETVQECLTDIEDKVTKGKPVGKYQWTTLNQNAANLSQVGGFVMQLVPQLMALASSTPQ